MWTIYILYVFFYIQVHTSILIYHKLKEQTKTKQINVIFEFE